MLIEGTGLIPPPVITERITRHDIESLRRAADAEESRRGYAHSHNGWRRGILANPTLVGKVGEFAFAQYMSRELKCELAVNNKDAPRGDGGIDFVIHGVRVQVKTRTRRTAVMIRRETEEGKILPIRWNVCVQCTYHEIDDPCGVTLDGYTTKEAILDSEFMKGRRGDWKNLEVPDELLLPVSRLLESIRNRIEWEGIE